MDTSLIIQEFISRQKLGFDLEAFCFKQQLNFIRDPARFKTAVCSRRAGKTVACAAHLIHNAIHRRGSVGVYITLTRANAKRIIWPDLLKINRDYSLGGLVNETELSIRFPKFGDSIIYCSGAKDSSEIEKFRGMAITISYIDECFPGDTDVDTPSGPKKIKDIKLGDKVFNATGVGEVISVSTKKVDKAIKLGFAGKTVTCSLNHPFFTERGWVNAGELRAGDYLVRQEACVRLVRDGVHEAREEGLSFLREQLLSEAQPVHQKPDERPENREESVGFFKKDWSQAENTWRQWERSNATRETYLPASIPGEFRGGLQLRDQNRRGQGTGLSHLLQSGLSHSENQISDRGRRTVPLQQEKPRPEERRLSTFQRLDSVEILEPSDLERLALGDFYDIGVSGHPSYSVADVLVHNCQGFRQYIRELVDDVISKALFDYNGALCLIGTPGPIPAGFFYECATSPDWSHHAWTMFDNPWLERKSGKKAMELIQEDLKRMGVTIDHPKIQRECFGKWVVDQNSLVFQYDRDRNHYDSLPARSQQWSYVIGVDVGFDDADAISVLAWHEHHPDVYLIHEEVQNQEGISALAARIKRLYDKYEPLAIVMDTGALGKKIADELTSRFSLPIQAAEKSRKLEHIELLNDAMRTGRFFAKRDSRFSQDCMLIEWDQDSTELKISDSYHSDIADSVLYAFRYCLQWLSTPEMIKPKANTPEWEEYQADEIERAIKSRLKEEQHPQSPWEGEW